MRLRDMWHLIRSSWVLILALVMAGAAVGLAYALVQRPVYSSTAKVFVSTGAASSVTDLSQGNSFTQQAAKSYAQIASAPIVLDRVTADLHLKGSSRLLANQ